MKLLAPDRIPIGGLNCFAELRGGRPAAWRAKARPVTRPARKTPDPVVMGMPDLCTSIGLPINTYYARRHRGATVWEALAGRRRDDQE